ncbi:PilN domain-containing protein [Massilia sp. ZL223]|uniref:PilN domain-containing protein n=1 Tax=Massilia sp. ZL223 TaxID=2824904 RepID=UPI001B82E5B4|nr:PilN domain-containing protein [Massilia sp. ZL223]MBQ5964132.1 PilN domain-containing protein [Massilia sp. ZL223]
MSQQINLFNPAFQPQKKVLTAATMAVSLALLAGGVGALASYGKMQTARLQEEANVGALRLEQKQARLASVSTEFAPRQKNREIDAQILEAEAQLAALRNISRVIERGELGDTSGYAGYFKALARQTVPGLWLTGVSVSGAGQEIGIKGRSTDPATLPGYLNRLTQEPLMRGKSFTSLQIGQAAPLVAAAADGKQGATPAPYVEFSLQSVPEEVRK